MYKRYLLFWGIVALLHHLQRKITTQENEHVRFKVYKNTVIEYIIVLWCNHLGKEIASLGHERCTVRRMLTVGGRQRRLYKPCWHGQRLNSHHGSRIMYEIGPRNHSNVYFFNFQDRYLGITHPRINRTSLHSQSESAIKGGTQTSSGRQKQYRRTGQKCTGR